MNRSFCLTSYIHAFRSFLLTCIIEMIVLISMGLFWTGFAIGILFSIWIIITNHIYSIVIFSLLFYMNALFIKYNANLHYHISGIVVDIILIFILIFGFYNMFFIVKMTISYLPPLLISHTTCFFVGIHLFSLIILYKLSETDFIPIHVNVHLTNENTNARAISF